MPTRSPAKKKTTSKRSPGKRKTVKKTVVKKAPKIKIIGKVVHYYDKIQVAIVKLASPLSVGDTVTFKRGDKEHTQRIGSMEMDHKAVQKAKRGQVIGVQVTQVIHDRAMVIPA